MTSAPVLWGAFTADRLSCIWAVCKINGIACISVIWGGMKMDAYHDFAYVYDELMDTVPYGQWSETIVELIEKYGVSKPDRETECLTDAKLQEMDALPEPEVLLEAERNLVVDLGCGTGTLTQMLYDKGYDMIGVDCSEEMLNVAMDKKERTGSQILYLLQDMRELELYSTVGTVVSVCDSLNYILEEDELLEVFQLVNNYLYPGGLFIFDFNTVYKYENLIGDATIAENREDCSFIWENFYDAEEELNEYDLTVFVQEEGDRFRRFSETHFQRGYTAERIAALVEQAGLQLVEMTDADNRGPVTVSSGRICVVARECMKKLPEQGD